MRRSLSCVAALVLATSCVQVRWHGIERTADVTAGVVETSRRWRAAREEQRTALVGLETEATYEAIQQFLAVVHALAAERRLSRIAYVGRRVENAV